MGRFLNSLVSSAGHAVGEQLVNGSKKSVAEVESARLELEKKQLAADGKKNELSEIANLKFGESANEISETINALFVQATHLPTGFKALGDDQAKAKKKAIIEKLDFGLFKLKKLDPDSAEFFQKKYDDLVNKKK